MRRISRVLIIITAFAIAVSSAAANPLYAQQTQSQFDEEFFSSNDILFYRPGDNDPCLPGISTSPGFTTIGEEIEVGAGVLGGSWDGSQLTPSAAAGITIQHNDRSVITEASSPGTQDYAQLAKLLNPPKEYLGWSDAEGQEGFKENTKFAITHKGKSIVVEKKGISESGDLVEGSPRAINLWYEAAKLLDFQGTEGKVTVQQVDSGTPPTMLHEQAFQNSTSGDVSVSAPSGGSTGERAFAFLLGKGLSRNQALGIIANLMQESGGGTLNLDPNALNPSSGAYGIAQWYMGRRAALSTFAASHNKPASDFELQLNFFWHELSTSYKNRVLDPIMASTTLSESSRIFLERFEVPCMPGPACDPEAKHRLSLGEKAERELSGVQGGSTGDVTTCEDGGGGGAQAVNADGYAMPIATRVASASGSVDPAAVDMGQLQRFLRCSVSNCHHDRSPAFDFMSPQGTDVYAITDGTVYSNKPYSAGGGGQCRSIQFKGDDGWIYWYGHTYVNPTVGKRFSAGEKMGVLGDKRCATADTHLHIDRGSPKGATGGVLSRRDAGFIKLIQNIITSHIGDGGSSGDA